MANTDFKSVSEYIATKPREVQAMLKRVRAAIRKAVPAAKEGISYQIPVYKLDGVAVVFFAGWKEHFSLYPAGDALVAAFKRELAGYKITKGTIRFPFSGGVPVDLIERIAKFRAEELVERGKGKRGRGSQLDRLRRLCGALPSSFEKVSHGTPTFFVEKDKGVYLMFADNHHNKGSLAVWLPVPPGHQAALIEDAPKTYFMPPYVGTGGWVGINLEQIKDQALEIHIRKAWELSSPKKKGKAHPGGVRGT